MTKLKHHHHPAAEIMIQAHTPVNCGGVSIKIQTAALSPQQYKCDKVPHKIGPDKAAWTGGVRLSQNHEFNNGEKEAANP